MSKVKEISEDDERRMQEEIQKITDEFIIEIDKLINAKEKDLLAI
jgi:ribosome recycling factor